MNPSAAEQGRSAIMHPSSIDSIENGMNIVRMPSDEAAVEDGSTLQFMTNVLLAPIRHRQLTKRMTTFNMSLEDLGEDLGRIPYVEHSNMPGDDYLAYWEDDDSSAAASEGQQSQSVGQQSQSVHNTESHQNMNLQRYSFSNELRMQAGQQSQAEANALDTLDTSFGSYSGQQQPPPYYGTSKPPQIQPDPANAWGQADKSPNTPKEKHWLEVDQDVLLANKGLKEIREAQARGEESPNWTSVPNPHTPSGDNNSLDVFLTFCKYYRDARESGSGLLVVDAKDILSRECFEMWLSTRQRALKKPEESYRKTVTAHTQGSDGRKPFPIEVERGLLVDLRRQEVWNCYAGRTNAQGERVSIGLQGFRGLGYHEKANTPEYLLPAKTAKKRKGLTDKAKRKRSSYKREVDVPIKDRVDANLQQWRSNTGLILTAALQLGVLPAEVFGNRPDMAGIFKNTQENVTNEQLFEVLGPMANPRTVRAAALVVFTRFFTPGQFFTLFSVCNLFDAKTFNNKFLSMDLSIRDDRIDPNFILPGKEGWEWFDLVSDLPIYQNSFSLDTITFIEQDPKSVKMLGNVKGKFASKLLHPFQFWMTLIQIIPRVVTSGQQVWQSYSRHTDGTPLISRTRYTLDPGGKIIHTEFQEVTHLYPEIMALPPLEDVIEQYNKKKNKRSK